MAVLYLIPDSWGDWQVKKTALVLMAVVGIVLIVLISRKREKENHVQVIGIDSVSQMNPGQYLSKAGPVCAGSDGRYHVTFLLRDDTRLILSLSGKQAGVLAAGMYGTLVHNGSVFVSFIPEK
ncbi:MAG: DUF2500 domain-containing protein [Lachnospiraceae bacterium]|nr:DUF2500 domain-containing protein [Lachnospiraceae bacterium]